MGEGPEGRQSKGKELLSAAERHQFDAYTRDIIANARLLKDNPNTVPDGRAMYTLLGRAQKLSELVAKMQFTFADLSPTLQEALILCGFDHLFEGEDRSPVAPERREEQATIALGIDREREALDALVSRALTLFAGERRPENLPDICDEIVRLSAPYGGVRTVARQPDGFADFILSNSRNSGGRGIIQISPELQRETAPTLILPKQEPVPVEEVTEKDYKFNLFRWIRNFFWPR